MQQQLITCNSSQQHATTTDSKSRIIIILNNGPRHDPLQTRCSLGDLPCSSWPCSTSRFPCTGHRSTRHLHGPSSLSPLRIAPCPPHPLLQDQTQAHSPPFMSYLCNRHRRCPAASTEPCAASTRAIASTFLSSSHIRPHFEIPSQEKVQSPPSLGTQP